MRFAPMLVLVASVLGAGCGRAIDMEASPQPRSLADSGAMAHPQPPSSEHQGTIDARADGAPIVQVEGSLGDAAKPAGELVVLAHGMGRTPASMLPLRWALEKAEYRVENWGYRSRSLSVAEAAEQLAARVAALDESRGEAPIHFVGHSLGNIVIRYLLAHHRPENVGRVVMLAPPNQGSAKADALESFTWLLKPLAELTTGEQSTARSIPAPEGVEIGIIAGEHDKKVTVEETHLEGETDHVVVASGHTFIMSRPAVHRLVVGFLRAGRFGDDEQSVLPDSTQVEPKP